MIILEHIQDTPISKDKITKELKKMLPPIESLSKLEYGPEFEDYFKNRYAVELKIMGTLGVHRTYKFEVNKLGKPSKH